MPKYFVDSSLFFVTTDSQSSFDDFFNVIFLKCFILK